MYEDSVASAVAGAYENVWLLAGIAAACAGGGQGVAILVENASA